MDHTERFAREALKLFGSEGAFTIGYPSEGPDLLKAAFEKLGCTVRVQGNVLEVTCPPSAG